MANTYYVSELTAAEIDRALEAISDVVSATNNGKVLCITDGAIDAKPASTWGGGGGYPEPTGTIDINANGLVDVKDYASANVQVSGSSAVVQPLSVTQNGTYNPPSGVDGYAPVTVNVSGGGGSVVRVSTRSMGGSDASVDVYVDELFIENVGFVSVSTGAYKDFGIIRVMYNTPASASPDGVAHTGWCVFALSTCTAIGSTYTVNQLVLEWPYNRSRTCVAVS